MDKKYPLRKNGISTRRIGDEWMLYNSEKGDIHVINSTAEFVWRMCDGSRSISEIIHQVRDDYELSDEINIKKDIEDIIQIFWELGVLLYKEV